MDKKPINKLLYVGASVVIAFAGYFGVAYATGGYAISQFLNDTRTNNTTALGTAISGGIASYGQLLGTQIVGTAATTTVMITDSGVTKFAFRYLGEVANSAPGGRNYLDQVFQADATGSTNDPKMTIVTSVPSPTPTSTPATASLLVIPSSGSGYVPWLLLLLFIAVGFVLSKLRPHYE